MGEVITNFVERRQAQIEEQKMEEAIHAAVGRLVDDGLDYDQAFNTVSAASDLFFDMVEESEDRTEVTAEELIELYNSISVRQMTDEEFEVHVKLEGFDD